MKKILIILVHSILVIVAGCQQDYSAMETEVSEVILKGEASWNEGSIEGYMETYWKSPELRFASGGQVTFGWQKTLDGYLKRYPDRAAMGRLVFSDLEIRVLSSDVALAFGTWRLERDHDQPHGLFTLQLHRFEEGWRIVHDHTSSGE
jgi:ketosteroid isomerase-like protein